MIRRERLPNRRHAETFDASLALQHGVQIETLRKAMMRDPRGNATGPFGVALDRIAQSGPRHELEIFPLHH